MRRRLGSGALLLAPLLASACASEPPARPNVLLVVVDTLRADHCSAYGYERDTTPHLGRLAREGVRFDAAYAPGATTGPSHASLFTGLQPRRHAVSKNGVRLGEEADTLAERLGAAGYATAAVVSSYVLDERFGFAQGFASYEDDFDPRTASVHLDEFEGQPVEHGFDRNARATTDRAIHRLGVLATTPPFFLFVHYFDPHDPYVAPPAWRQRFPAGGPTRAARAAALYDAEVAYTDEQIGRLLAALAGLELAGPETLVIVTADHGEGLYDHGYLFHDLHLYEEAVRVPLLMRWPGLLEAGRRVAAPVALVDLLPTLLDLLELPRPDDLDGRSLAAALQDGARFDADRPVYLERRAFQSTRIGNVAVRGDKLAVRRGPWKYIEAPDEGTRELFDLSADPGERENLAGTHAERAAALSAELERLRSAAPRRSTASPAPDEQRRLEALGYTE